MVKHGRDKKRRSGRIGKTKLKNRSWVRYDPKLKVNTVLKEHWDITKTPASNLIHLGLVANPNVGLSNTTSNTAVSTTTTTTTTTKMKANSSNNKQSVVELFDVPDSDGIYRDPNKAPRQYPMSLEDETYILKCLTKYGTDYVKMFRDIKLNNMQHTEEKLRKLASRYLLLSKEQRRIQDIPESVQQLLVK